MRLNEAWLAKNFADTEPSCVQGYEADLAGHATLECSGARDGGKPWLEKKVGTQEVGNRS